MTISLAPYQELIFSYVQWLFPSLLSNIITLHKMTRNSRKLLAIECFRGINGLQ